MSIDQARVPNALTAPRGLEVETHAVAQAIGLSKVHGGGAAEVVALNDVTVQFGRGQLTAIMGPSGSGKSTLCTAWPHWTLPPRARSSST